MKNSIETHRAIEQATNNLDQGEEFKLHPEDASPLIELTPAQLVRLGYGRSWAEEICAALRRRDYNPYVESFGIRVVFTVEAPRLP